MSQGGYSLIGLKTYASGREKFQGETLDFVWFDEEPPADIYTEGSDANERWRQSGLDDIHTASRRVHCRQALPARAIAGPPQGGDDDR